MELVQWVVPLDDGSFGVGFAPSGCDRMPAVGSLKASAGAEAALGRRGPQLCSPLLVYPLGIGAFEGCASDDAPVRGVKAGALAVSLRFTIDGDGRALVPPGADDVRLAGLLAELVRVVAELCDAARLPVLGIAPERERRGLDLAVGTLGAFTITQLADALCLFRVAIELCAQARGLQLADALLLLEGKSAPLDARVARALAVMMAGDGQQEQT